MKKQKKQLRCDEYLTILKEHPLVIVIHYNNLIYNYTRIEQTMMLLEEQINAAFEPILKTDGSILGIKIMKNTLAKHTLETTIYTAMSNLFAGPTLILYSKKISPTIVRIVIQWIQTLPYLYVVGAKYDNTLVNVDELIQITQLPETPKQTISHLIIALNDYIIRMTNTISITNVNLCNTLEMCKNKHNMA